MADADAAGCAADEVVVDTARIPVQAPIDGNTAIVSSQFTNDVAFWVLVP